METEKQVKNSLEGHLMNICILLGSIALIWTFLIPWETTVLDRRITVKIFELVISTWFMSLNISRILTGQKFMSYFFTGLWILVFVIWLVR